MKFSVPILLFLTIFVFACKTEQKQTIPTTKVKHETFYIDLYEDGEVKATKSIAISSPHISWRYGMLKVTDIVDDGQEVKAGDTVMAFDPTEVRKAIVDAESKLEIHKAELEKMKAEQQSEMEELLSDFEITKLTQEISRIEFESAEYEADIDKQEIKLELDKADISLEQAATQIENKKKIQHEELSQKLLDIKQSQTELDDSYNTLNMLNVVTPSPGIAIISRNWSTEAKYQVGDQVWSGDPMITLPNLNELKAEVKINEVDISKISNGLRVEIRPDAFSDSLYSGKVTSIANLAVNKSNKSKIKVFPVEILIDGVRGSLMPGLTVGCRIIIDEIPNSVFVPKESIFGNIDNNYVYVKTSRGFRKQEVKTGISNSDFTIIEKGLDGDETIALVDPFATESNDNQDSKETTK